LSGNKTGHEKSHSLSRVALRFDDQAGVANQAEPARAFSLAATEAVAAVVAEIAVAVANGDSAAVVARWRVALEASKLAVA
jgi:hypothetical protein